MSIFSLKATGYANNNEQQDLAQVAKALSIFPDPDHYIFMQALPSAVWRYFQGSDTKGIIKFVEENQDAKSLFYAINPSRDAHAHAMRVGDAAYRRWILVDVDRNKTLQPDDPATEQEHDDAKELAFEVMSFLADIGFPPPIQVDSGNGFHLYYRVFLPNDTEHRDLVHDFLKLLDNTFSDIRGTIGEECFDARRLSRLPGCWSRRGKASKARPYRMCRFAPHTPTAQIVPVELIRKVVGGPVQPQPTKTLDKPKPSYTETLHKANGNGHASAFQVPVESEEDKRRAAYARQAIDKECAELAGSPVGERNNQLFKTAAALYELVAGGLVDEKIVECQIWLAARQCGLEDEKEIKATVESAKRHGMTQPRAMPAAEAQAATQPQVIEPGKRIIVLASEIEPRSVEWLWPGRIPLGKLTTFAGNGGLGKTMCLTDITARITNGAAWPDGASGNSPGKVLYVSGEDDPEDTLVPRLIAAGGKRENVAYFIPEVLGKFTLADLPALDMALDQLGDNCLLVAIDPPTAYLGGINDHKNAELRSLLTPLAGWAAKRRVAVVFISHVTKPAAAKVEAIMRVLGSVAWVNAVRAAHMFTVDPDDDDRCLFVPMKSNLGKRRKGLAYQIQEVEPGRADGMARVAWLGEIDTTANEAVAGSRNEKKRGEKAADWLVEKFREKLEWEAEDLFKEAKNNNFSRNSVFEAKDILSLPKARRVMRLDGSVSWVWWVPPDWSNFNCPKCPDEKQKPPGQLGHLTDVLEL